MQGGIVCISLRKNGSLINLACERRRASEIGIADSCNDLGAMAWAIAIVHRNDDVEEKWVVAPEGMTFTKEEIREQIHFQEQYFDSEIVM